MSLLTRLILGLFVFVLGVSQVNASDRLSKKDLRHAQQLRDRVLKANEAYNIVESLTSEVGARMGGTAGDKAAVEWAVNKLKTYQFDKVWTEPVTFPSWKRGVEQASIVSPYAHKMVITALGNSISTPTEGLQGEVVHFKTYDDLLKAHKRDVAGKIVFISNRMQRKKNAAGYGKAVVARSKGAAAAGKLGAIAIIIRSIGTDTARMPHTGYMGYEEDVNKIPAVAASNPDADLMVNILNRGEPLRIKLNVGSGPGEDYTSANVIGEIKGTGNSGDYVLLAAHLDSWDLGTGAIDDASGVAIVMEAARQIALAGKRPKHTIRVVLYANEEQGVYGGNQYAQAHEKELSRIVAAAESDLGAGVIWRFSTTARKEAQKVVRQIYKVLKPLKIEFGGKTYGGADIEPLGKKGVPLFELSQDATMYFNYHHTPDDTLDKVNVEELNQNVAAYVVFAYLAAQSPIRF